MFIILATFSIRITDCNKNFTMNYNLRFRHKQLTTTLFTMMHVYIIEYKLNHFTKEQIMNVYTIN